MRTPSQSNDSLFPPSVSFYRWLLWCSLVRRVELIRPSRHRLLNYCVQAGYFTRLLQALSPHHHEGWLDPPAHSLVGLPAGRFLARVVSGGAAVRNRGGRQGFATAGERRAAYAVEEVDGGDADLRQRRVGLREQIQGQEHQILQRT